MTQTHQEPADLAADEIVTLLKARRDAGDFDAILATVSGIVCETITKTEVSIVKRDVPLALLEDLATTLEVSVIPGPEGERELLDRRSSDELFTVDLAVEVQLDETNSAASQHLRQLSRYLADWMLFQDPESDRRQRRRLDSVDALARREESIAKFDPTQLLGSSVFLSLRRFHYQGVT